MSQPNPEPNSAGHRTSNRGTAETPVTETAEQARQGRPGRPVWFVLVVSTALAAAILGVLLLFFTGTSDAAIMTL